MGQGPPLKFQELNTVPDKQTSKSKGKKREKDGDGIGVGILNTGNKGDMNNFVNHSV